MSAMQPVLGPLVDGDLCDIRVGRGICGQDAERLVWDVDGRERLLCAACVALYFPAEVVGALSGLSCPEIFPAGCAR